jgi:CubicO group peptidase (beta-lactamase class C family)
MLTARRDQDDTGRQTVPENFMHRRLPGLVVAASLLLHACGGALPPPASAPLTADPQALDQYLAREVVDRGLVGLSVAIMREGKIILAKGYGRRSLETGRPVEPETMFAVGSITKQFTSACVLLLAEEGKLSVDDRVAKYFPRLAGATEITLLDLMGHTSGYPDYYPLDFVDRRLQRPIAANQLVQDYAGGKLDFTPGTRWSYSNTGFVLLALIIEKVAGEPFGRFLERRILKPLGMTHTRYEPTRVGEQYAQSYFSVGLADPESAPDEAADWLRGAAGLYSTPTDLARWNLALMTGRVLRPESYRLMTTPRPLANGAPTDYGCGLWVSNRHGEPMLRHDGMVAGFVGSNRMFPATRSAVVLVLNSTRYGELDRLTDALVEAVVPRTDVPTAAGPAAVEVARDLLRQLQGGTLKRPRFGAAFNELMTEERIRRAAARLAPYGEPRSATLESRRERGGMEATTVLLTFRKGTLRALMFRSPDGIVQELLIEKADAH